ncbi:hypothetical protein ACHAPO_003303 [Fusarium lateritium]
MNDAGESNIEEGNSFQDNNSEGSNVTDIESQYVNALDTLAELADNSGVTPTEAIIKFIHELDRKFNMLIQVGQCEVVATMRGEPVTEDRRVKFDYIDEALDAVSDIRDQALDILHCL